jgi:hypothetical protein
MTDIVERVRDELPLEAAASQIYYLRARVAELESALEQSVKLQSHYAMLLNDWDGGTRLRFDSVKEWLAKLAALAQRDEMKR